MQGEEMPRRTNPFKPTAGMNPPELIGRDMILDDFSEALANGVGAPDRLMRISGVRGVGKTVLLNALGDIARANGFVMVDVASNAGFCDRILHALTGRGEISSLTTSPSILGMGLGSAELARPATQLGEAMLTASKRSGLLVTLDEIQDAPIDELRELGNEIQLLIRQGANVAFAFAGLPTAVDGVVGVDTLTFLQRARHVELTRLNDAEVEESLAETIRLGGSSAAPGVPALLAGAASGYPFMVQLVGYYAWQSAARRKSDEIGTEDARRGISLARRNFDGMVIEPALRRLSPRQLEYLVAMAECEGDVVSSGEVAERMGLAARDVGSYRRRLLDAALIEQVGYGKAAFSIPYMRDYLREHRDELMSLA